MTRQEMKLVIIRECRIKSRKSRTSGVRYEFIIGRSTGVMATWMKLWKSYSTHVK